MENQSISPFTPPFERRGHTRHYSDGREIEISSTMVCNHPTSYNMHDREDDFEPPCGDPLDTNDNILDACLDSPPNSEDNNPWGIIIIFAGVLIAIKGIPKLVRFIKSKRNNKQKTQVPDIQEKNNKGAKTMSKFKVVINYSEGTSEEDDDIFDTEAEAEEHGCYMCSCCRVGAQVSHLSNPGDYPLDEDYDVDFEVIEV